MADVIEIKSDSVLLVSPALRQDYVDVLNGIVWDCWHNHGFERGTRNTIAVDLGVCCGMLSIDWEDILDKLVDLKVIDLLDDDENTYNRLRTVMDYEHRFSWEWMLDADNYREIGAEHASELDKMPLMFVLR